MKIFGGKGALFAAVALGALTSFLVWRYVDQVSQAARPIETMPVVVAAAPIPARSVIRPEMLRVQQVPVDGRHPDSYRAPDEVAGKVARTAMTPGEHVLNTKLFLQRAESGLAFMIPDNMRAVSVGFTEVIGSGGLIVPGDRVDIIGVFEYQPSDLAPAAGPVPDSVSSQGTQAVMRSGSEETSYLASMVLQDVVILAVAQRLEGQDTRDTTTSLAQAAGAGATTAQGQTTVRSNQPAQPQAKTATLAVTPEDALRLVLAEERGKIRLALRRANDEALTEVAALSLPALLEPSNPRPAAASAGQ